MSVKTQQVSHSCAKVLGSTAPGGGDPIEAPFDAQEIENLIAELLDESNAGRIQIAVDLCTTEYVRRAPVYRVFEKSGHFPTWRSNRCSMKPWSNG